MLPEDESSYTTATAEGLVVATIDDTRCLPANGAFGGVSTLGNWLGERVPFETCYYQLKQLNIYCWTKSYYSDDNYYPCEPLGEAWHAISAEDVNPVTHPKSCGTQYQVVIEEFG